MAQQKKQLGLVGTADVTWVHRAAGLAAVFEWQDAGKPAEVDYTTVLGTLATEEGKEPVYVVHVQGTADSGHGYSYPIETKMTVTRKGDGEPKIDEVPDEYLVAKEQS